MKLYCYTGFAIMLEPLYRSIIRVSEPYTQAGTIERWVYGISVILTCHVTPPCGEVNARLVLTPVTILQLKCLAS